MPVTIGEAKRIKRLHDSNDHTRCDIRKCASAAKEYEELEVAPDDGYYRRMCGLRAKALLDECKKQGLNFADYVDSVSEAMEDIRSLDGEEPDIVSVLAARAEIKMMP